MSRLLPLLAALALLFSACAAHRMCDDFSSKEPPAQSKRYKAAIAERDSLCSLSKVLEEQKQEGMRREAGLREDLAEQQRRYDQLSKAAGEEVESLSNNLLQRESDLADKERQLRDRDAKLRALEDIVRKQDELMNALSDRIKNALLGFSDDELSVETRNGKVYVSMSDKLLFRSGSDAVEAKGKEALGKLAEVLNRNLDINIQIEGHTDSIPISTARFRDNWDLSTARATSVIRLLTGQYAMDSNRLLASGMGEHSPVAPNRTPEGRAKNRRTEIILSPKLDLLMSLMGK